MLWSAVHQPIGQGTNGPSNYLSAGQDFISLCVYYDLYGTNSSTAHHLQLSLNSKELPTPRISTITLGPRQYSERHYSELFRSPRRGIKLSCSSMIPNRRFLNNIWKVLLKLANLQCKVEVLYTDFKHSDWSEMSYDRRMK